MNERLDIHLEIRRWVEKADHDLRNAELVVIHTEDCPTDTVCFHCQQCTEKYLKVLLISRGIAFPKTHDLVVLFNLAYRRRATSNSTAPSKALPAPLALDLRPPRPTAAVPNRRRHVFVPSFFRLPHPQAWN